LTDVGEQFLDKPLHNTCSSDGEALKSKLSRSVIPHKETGEGSEVAFHELAKRVLIQVPVDCNHPESYVYIGPFLYLARTGNTGGNTRRTSTKRRAVTIP